MKLGDRLKNQAIRPFLWSAIDVQSRSIWTDPPSLVDWTSSILRATRMTYLYLAIAIVGEVTATSVLKATNHFSRPGPTAVVATGYVIAFYAMSLALKTMPVGVAYAIWCGLGIVLVAVVGAVLYREIPDRATMLGMFLIIAGIVVINAFSKTGNG
jgi:small multidrug resistance pump